MKGLVVQVLSQEAKKIGDSKDEPVVIDEGIGRDLSCDLFFSFTHVFNVIDRESWDQDEEIIQVFVFFARELGKHLDHEIQIVNLITEVVLELPKNVIKLLASTFRGLAEIGTCANLL